MFVPSLYALLSGVRAPKAAAQNKDTDLTMSEETRRKQ
jgi:hypothetical protein